MDIHDILHRYMEGDVTPEEKRQVILWLEENPEHVKEYSRMRKLYDLNTWNAGQAEQPSIKSSSFSLMHYVDIPENLTPIS